MPRDSAHGPLLRKSREAGSEPKAFGQGQMRLWVILALLALAATAILPILFPRSVDWLQRTTPALALFFFLSAMGWWFRMQERAFAVAGAFVALLYAATAWAPIAFDVDDFSVLALLSSFAVFALAGFNLVFILEEVLFDAHRELRVARKVLQFAPSVLVVVLAGGLPVIEHYGGGTAPTLWVASVIWTILYIGWWVFRAVNPVEEEPILRELHMLTAGTLAATGLVDLASIVRPGAGVLPSVLMYGVLVGTWIYVSYTSLQRAHFLLRGQNAIPWLCILLSASFALLQHASFHYQVEGARAITQLLEQRVGYLVAGIWIGLAFYVVQGLWRVLRRIRDSRSVGARARIMAGSLARMAEGLAATEHRIQGVAVTLFSGMDRILPGHQKRPKVPVGSWDLGEHGMAAVAVDGVTDLESE